MPNPRANDSVDLSDIRFVKRVSLGDLNPNRPTTEQQREQQMRLLNRMLNDYPQGRIIGREISTAVYQVGDHQISMQQITYHVGFRRKPAWIVDEPVHPIPQPPVES